MSILEVLQKKQTLPLKQLDITVGVWHLSRPAVPLRFGVSVFICSLLDYFDVTHTDNR